MRFLPLTAYENWPVIKQIAWFFGLIMQGIFVVLSKFSLPSVAVCIIIFTIITKMLLLPLTVKQQRFMKLNSIMQPEIQAIQKKYAGRRDQSSVSKMQVEQQAVYEKYGSSMTAGCLPSFIQLPILFGLYPVIYSFQNYVPQMANYTEAEQTKMFMLFGLDLRTSPSFDLPATLLIPVLAGALTFFTTKLSSARNKNSRNDDPSQRSMRMMMYTMPLFSVFICYTLPCFLGVYWITQSLVMIVQQILINRHYDKIPVEQLIAQNREKMNKKRAKKGLPPLSDKATVNTKKLDAENKKKMDARERRDAKIKESTEYYNNQTGGSGSLAAKANMVRDYNQKHNVNTTRKKK